MGSRPSHPRTHEEANGTVTSTVIQELKATNALLQEKLKKLEQSGIDENIRQENERLRKQNKELTEKLHILQRSFSVNDMFLSNKTDQARKSNKSAGDKPNRALSSQHQENEEYLKHSKSEEAIGQSSSNSKHYENELKPSSSSSHLLQVHNSSGKRRKINPKTIPQRLSDIDAYGQGLPLEDAEQLRENIRRTRRRRQHDSGNSSTSSVQKSPSSVLSDTPSVRDVEIHTNIASSQETDADSVQKDNLNASFDNFDDASNIEVETITPSSQNEDLI